ncbi:MAG: hypothetical protein AYL28_000630 [Candidatus Bathyarchaeota archaeon B23]|nr:MAG: hypothetical protein AYL28_000630 [Candidatus Bathyarchaeota archaeon B23]
MTLESEDPSTDPIPSTPSPYDMRSIAPTVCGVLGVRPPSSAEAEAIAEAVRPLGVVEHLAVVVLDAFGISTWRRVKAVTPTFNALAERHSLIIRAVYPTITPVNFATMVTGAGPERHGIRERTQRIRLETVFDVLREGEMTSATAARALSSLGMLISPHVDQPGIAASNRDEEVCRIALEALERGVNLLWVQLLDVDEAGHRYGPLSREGREAAARCDRHLRAIAEAAERRGFSLIALADHGQHGEVVDGVVKGTHGSRREEDLYVPLLWRGHREIGGVLKP